MEYSKRYFDDDFEYQLVFIPDNIQLPSRTLSSNQWKGLGLKLSDDWENINNIDNQLIFRKRHYLKNLERNKFL